MQDKIKEHNWDIRVARTQTSAFSGHAHNNRHHPLWNEVKFVDRDPHHYTRRVKVAIHRLYPNNINRDSGIEIPEAWMPSIKVLLWSNSRYPFFYIFAHNRCVQDILPNFNLLRTTELMFFEPFFPRIYGRHLFSLFQVWVENWRKWRHFLQFSTQAWNKEN